MWLALGALVAASAGWGYTRGLSAEREERDRIVAEFAAFRERTAAEGRQAQAHNAAEIKRQEAINAQTHTAYGVALDRLRALHAADRLRLAAARAAHPGSGGVPADAAPAGGADAPAADTGSAPAGSAPADTLIERCQATTLQCAWLQDWVREQSTVP